MINVTLRISCGGLFSSCEATGHALYAKKGSDIVCSAVTVLLRTAMQVLDDTKGVRLKSGTYERGQLVFSAECNSEADKKNEAARLVCVADVIDKGLTALMQEYPQYVQFAKVIEGE